MPRQKRGGHDHQHHWNDPADTPQVEIGQRERPTLQLTPDDRRDQKAGNDEEDVDANVAARQPDLVDVVEHHADDGDGPQAVDLRPIGASVLNVRYHCAPLDSRTNSTSRSIF